MYKEKQKVSTNTNQTAIALAVTFAAMVNNIIQQHVYKQNLTAVTE